MTFNCNGCGGEFEDEYLAATFSYGDVSLGNSGASGRNDGAYAEHHRTLCPRCQHVQKDILLSSDLSDHWHKYNWRKTAQREPYDNNE